MGSDGLGSLGFEVLWGAEAAVGLSFRKQALSVLGVDCQALGLAIGTVRAFIGQTGTLVPIKAEPAKVFHELGFVAGFGALQVGVLDAEEEFSAGVAGEKPVVQGGARVADVKHASGGRGKSDTGRCCGHDSIDDRRFARKWRRTVALNPDNLNPSGAGSK